MKEKTLTSIFLVFSLLLVTSLIFVVSKPSKSITSAFIISAPSAKMVGEITGGGRNLTGVYNLKVAVGQSVVGNISNANLRICLGVLCSSGLASHAYSINFTGQLNYSNGTAVSNSLITVYITYLTDTYSESNTTDNNGNFLIVINNIPNLENKNFNVKFYLEGEIEATYECRYDHITENCNPI